MVLVLLEEGSMQGAFRVACVVAATLGSGCTTKESGCGIAVFGCPPTNDAEQGVPAYCCLPYDQLEGLAPFFDRVVLYLGQSVHLQLVGDGVDRVTSVHWSVGPVVTVVSSDPKEAELTAVAVGETFATPNLVFRDGSSANSAMLGCPDPSQAPSCRRIREIRVVLPPP